MPGLAAGGVVGRTVGAGSVLVKVPSGVDDGVQAAAIKETTRGNATGRGAWMTFMLLSSFGRPACRADGDERADYVLYGHLSNTCIIMACFAQSLTGLSNTVSSLSVSPTPSMLCDLESM